MSYTKESTFCQMSMTKPHTECWIFHGMYIFMSFLCNLVNRYTFNKLIPKLRQYTSYKAGNLSKVVPTIETTCYEK